MKKINNSINPFDSREEMLKKALINSQSNAEVSSNLELLKAFLGKSKPASEITKEEMLPKMENLEESDIQELDYPEMMKAYKQGKNLEEPGIKELDFSELLKQQKAKEAKEDEAPGIQEIDYEKELKKQLLRKLSGL